MQTGYNKLNITPKKAVRIAGYNRKELSKGVLDPIEINSLVIKEYKQTIIISILDSIIIEDSVILPVKQAIFDKYGIPFERFHFEITESRLTDEKAVRETLTKLKENGAKIALDDFGTGYSNIASIMLMPIDFVKIDLNKI